MHKAADKLPQNHSTRFKGLPLVIQWPKGSTRVGENPDGSEFRSEMQADYGYIADTESKDGEHMDVYVGPNPNAENVYAVEQLDESGETDEYKLMLGFDSLEDAEEMFALHAGEERLGDISEIPFDYLFDMVEYNQEEHEGEPIEEENTTKKAAAGAEYQADAYIEWGGMYDHRRLTLDEYKGVYEWTDWDASNELNLGEQVGECSSTEEAKSKLEQFVFRLGEPNTYIAFPEGAIKKKDYLNPGEKKFLDEVGVDADIKPDFNRPIPTGKPEPEFDQADKARLKGLGVIGSQHTVIDAFIKNYEHEVDFYQECASVAQDKLDQALQDAGIKAVVSSRAKRPQRLQKKLYKRDPKKHYQTFRDIYDDIIDLAGVRVALYLPADQERLGEIIQQIFQPIREPKHFPEDRDPGDSLGYVATHYLVHLNPETLRRKELRYADTQVEIQVASVLMHAWAEVTHDLIYKPEKGRLTSEEMTILKELNDIVQQGEAHLERLQEAIEGRSGEDLRFEISASLAKVASVGDFRQAIDHIASLPVAAASSGIMWVWNEQYGTVARKGGRGDHVKFFRYPDNPKGVMPPNLYDKSVRGYATVSSDLKRITLELSEGNSPENRFVPSGVPKYFQIHYPGYEVVTQRSAWASYVGAQFTALRQAGKREELDAKLREYWKKREYEQSPVPNTEDDKYWIEALRQIGQGRRWDQLTKEERSKVPALAQDLKAKNQPL